jgi:hypothetical protein
VDHADCRQLASAFLGNFLATNIEQYNRYNNGYILSKRTSVSNFGMSSTFL